MKRLALAIALVMLCACDEAVPTDLAPRPDGVEPAKDSAEFVKNPAMLPAYKLPWEYKVPGKSDAASDFRKMHPQWYAITQPAKGNYRPMQEWEPMQANIITYSNYLPSDAPVAQTMADIVVGSLPAGEVWVIVDSPTAKAHLIGLVKKAGITDAQIQEKVKFFPIVNDAIWQIDYGPLPLVNTDDNTVAFADFRYYPPRYLDDAIPTRLGQTLGTVTYRAPMDFEGGNFQADGEEYCYTTERLYLYTGWNFKQVEDMMKQYYGCKKAVVVKDITNDGTGHIDMFFKLGGKHVAFVGEYTVVKDDVNKKRMDDNVKQLEALKYSDGSEGITVYRIPMPNAGKAFGESIPRTFINSTLFASKDGSYKVNLWPIYTVDKDLEAQALEAWEQGMPDWEHVGVISDQVSLYSGAIHCVTRTIPALPLAKWVPDGECEEGVCDGGADGYSGPCIAATEPEPGCWGPAWECLCNDCDVQSCKIPAGCGNATCDDGETCFSCPGDCKCGADEACNVATGKCASNLCGNEKCDAGENCFSCAADCGCKTGTTCSFGVCSADPCDGITYDGCCDGNLLVYCEESNLVTQDCGTDGCGWNEGNAWYDCGFAGSDPSGNKPGDCGQFNYPPGCEGKECGDNGGGYSCGECSGKGAVCTPEGTCCVPGCGGKQCGDDGCGGVCGECTDGTECVDGMCSCVPDCEGKQCGDDGCGGVCAECAAGSSCDANFTCAPDPVEPDVVTGEDVPVGGDVTVGEDTGTTDEGGGGSDCSVAGTGAPSAAALVAGLLLALAAFRRRMA